MMQIPVYLILRAYNKITQKTLTDRRQFQIVQMQKNELKKEIDALIDSIKKQADRMNTEENLSKIELELFHHKIQKLYEKSILIHQFPAFEEKPFVSYPASPAEEVKPALPFRYSKEESPQEEKSPQPPIAPIPKQEPIQEPVMNQKAEIPEPQKPVETKPAADLFGSTIQAESKMTIRIKNEKDKTPRIARKPIPDLKVAVGLNDKFRFINDLFHGNSTEYHIALNQINTCNGFEEADIYITNIRDIYQWKDDNEVVAIFLDLVQRRFL
jgi:hypothetical protein